MTIEVGPIGVHFTNVNRAMALPGHSHYAEVSFGLAVLGPLGFPVFARTVEPVADALSVATSRPFRDHTNEDVLGALGNVVESALAQMDGFGESWGMEWVELGVMGVQDKIGHSPGMTRYRLVADPTRSSMVPLQAWPREAVA